MAEWHVALVLLMSLWFFSKYSFAMPAAGRRTFIVRVDGQAWPVVKRSHGSNLRASTKAAFVTAKISRHESFLARVDATSTSKHYSYTHSMDGFAAALSEKQATALRGMEGVVSVQPDQKRSIRTTYSPTFLGLNDPHSKSPPGVYTKRNGKGMILGVIDSGIWPENWSFNDIGYPKPPAKFKGICQTGEKWTAKNCNRKIIGARYYLAGYEAAQGKILSEEYRSPRDALDHGTHTASTAAGSKVFNASIGSVNMGTAQGIAYGAHISVYKVCYVSNKENEECMDSDILKAIDQAIEDNVDVISMSIGEVLPKDPMRSAIEHGTLMAAIAGIPTALPAGNDGSGKPIQNICPWHLTVAASTLPRDTLLEDPNSSGVYRQAKKKVYLGDSSYFLGSASTNGTIPPGATSPKLPLIHAEKAARKGVDAYNAGRCEENALNRTIVWGKIIVCDDDGSNAFGQGFNALKAGAKGMILRPIIDDNYIQSDYHVLPVISVSYNSGLHILRYLKKTKNPTAAISPLVINVGGTSEVAYFSSRGPNSQRNIMKPDVVAPGGNIFASVIPFSRQTSLDETSPPSQFNFLSGTSMATPHVAGALLLLKSLKPKWSPGALQSALSTTAKPLSQGNNNDFGSGMIRPNYAVDPGLVYDSDIDDYALYLCSYYKTSKVKQLVGKSCPKSVKVYDYNSPSLMIDIKNGKMLNTTREVTNVGSANIEYNLFIQQPKGAHVTITPTKLIFTPEIRRIKFKISVLGNASSRSLGIFQMGFWRWTSTGSKYQVQSPILVRIT